MKRKLQHHRINVTSWKDVTVLWRESYSIMKVKLHHGNNVSGLWKKLQYLTSWKDDSGLCKESYNIQKKCYIMERCFRIMERNLQCHGKKVITLWKESFIIEKNVTLWNDVSGLWKEPFEKHRTMRDNFHLDNKGMVQTDFMTMVKKYFSLWYIFYSNNLKR